METDMGDLSGATLPPRAGGVEGLLERIRAWRWVRAWLGMDLTAGEIKEAEDELKIW